VSPNFLGLLYARAQLPRLLLIPSIIVALQEHASLSFFSTGFDGCCREARDTIRAVLYRAHQVDPHAT
jgi:hypothetical protein